MLEQFERIATFPKNNGEILSIKNFNEDADFFNNK